MDEQPKSQQETVKGFWNERHQDVEGEAHDNYLSHPLIQAYMSLRALGSLVSHMDAAEAALRTYTEPGDTIISLGCGAASKERHLARSMPDRQFVGIDIADEIIAMAQEEIAAEGLTNLQIEQGDFNQLELAENRTKALLGLGAIHHVENLENLWEQTRKTLVPGGIVLAQEYVGPNRFQWTDAQIAACNQALDELVPDEHKVHHTVVERVPLDVIIAGDPSEAVRSAEILPTCEAAGFTIQALESAGGALLQPMLMYQVHTFDPRNWQHNLTLSRLFEREDQLMRDGVLQDDFAVLVARP